MRRALLCEYRIVQIIYCLRRMIVELNQHSIYFLLVFVHLFSSGFQQYVSKVESNFFVRHFSNLYPGTSGNPYEKHQILLAYKDKNVLSPAKDDEQCQFRFWFKDLHKTGLCNVSEVFLWCYFKIPQQMRVVFIFKKVYFLILVGQKVVIVIRELCFEGDNNV